MLLATKEQFLPRPPPPPFSLSQRLKGVGMGRAGVGYIPRELIEQEFNVPAVHASDLKGLGVGGPRKLANRLEVRGSRGEK